MCRSVARIGAGAGLLLCVLAAAAAGGGGFTVGGRIEDERGRPLAGATVTIRDGEAELARGVTGPEGAFSIALAGEALVGRRHAYGPVTVLVEAERRALHRENFVAAGTQDLRVVLHPARAVSGTVLDLAGAPLADVNVVARHASARTDESGAFSIPAAGADVEWLSVHGGEAKPTRVRLPPSGRVEARVERMPYETFAGRVTRAPDGAPVAGARVTRLDGRPAVTAADGRFTIRLQRKGVSLGGAGFASGQGYVEVIAPGYAIGIVKVVDGEPLDCRLEPVPPVHGRVADEEGNPVAGAEVTLSSSRMRPVGGVFARIDAATDTDGRFRFDAYPHDGFRFVVRAHGFLDAESEGPEVVLRRGRTARGRVVDAAGSPVVGARIDGRGYTGVAFSDHEGRFAAAAIPDGETALRAVRDRRWSVWATVAGPGDLVLQETLPLAGDLADDAGAPLAGVEVRCTADGGFDRTATTDATGAFRFDDLPLSYFTLEAAPAGHARSRAYAGAGETVRMVADRASGDSVLVVRFRGSGPGRVRVWATRRSLRRDAIADLADGAVTFDDLVPGTYDVTVEAVGHEPHRAQVEVGERTTHVAELARGAPLAIRTHPGARVDVLTLRGREAPDRAEAGADGTATVFGVGPGAYLLVARAPGRLLAVREIEVAGAPPAVELPAPEGARLSVRVVDEAGVPVRGARFVLAIRSGREIPIAGETADDGQAVLTELAEGEVVIRAAEGDREGEAAVRVAPGADLEATLVLEGGGTD